ncbi:DUF4440 domain-containing protein [Streptosporangium roseum]|uniref:Uncharacterized protein n=1 Tax=Streptosporangium roseum (strain ATCC 12428 / DSM 43021 / JCM 3005 / KCTC 9067 / NCIMB 10171 / NRRL 2505 / NI 9100) TaxID=479432 RepID=D2BAU6_STRRD|nr:DUF4440 domain-containing protein [Streptosporangium roseum]ACZ91710.1 conserved hypothetical protein [Streptosporangium roseum DSM 43021]
MTGPHEAAGGTARGTVAGSVHGTDAGGVREAADGRSREADAGSVREAADGRSREADVAAACRAEIVRLHEVIERWLSGRAPRTAEEFDAFAGSLLPGFTLSGPDGPSLTRDQVLAWVEAEHGRTPGIEIRIREVELVAADGSLLVAAYQEWQRGTGADRNRRSTAVFLRDPAAPHGLRWRHLHETWMPGTWMSETPAPPSG